MFTHTEIYSMVTSAEFWKRSFPSYCTSGAIFAEVALARLMTHAEPFSTFGLTISTITVLATPALWSIFCGYLDRHDKRKLHGNLDFFIGLLMVMVIALMFSGFILYVGVANPSFNAMMWWFDRLILPFLLIIYTGIVISNTGYDIKYGTVTE